MVSKFQVLSRLIKLVWGKVKGTPLLPAALQCTALHCQQSIVDIDWEVGPPRAHTLAVAMGSSQ